MEGGFFVIETATASWRGQSPIFDGKIDEKFDVLRLNCYCKKVPRVSGPCRRGSSTHGWVEKNPRDLRFASSRKTGGERLRYTGYKRFTVEHSWSIDPNGVSLRPIAIVPATPSTLDGLCGPEQRNGVGSSLVSRGKTLDHRRLLCLVCCTALQTRQQGRSSPETLQRSHFFACTAKSEA